MMKILVWAVLAAIAAAAILIQTQGTTELALWETLLLVLVALQYRVIPDRYDPLEKSLFNFALPEPRRLPRDVASMELAVVDATTGYLDPDRRLLPALRRIAAHRLSRQGAALESELAYSLLGELPWRTLMNQGDGSMSSDDLEALVSRLEEI